MRTWHHTLGVAVLASTLTGCGGGDPTGPGAGSPMTARVDGQPWSAHELSAAAIPGQSGLFTITGTESVNNVSRSITLSLYNIRGTGSYALGVTSVVVGGRAQFSEAGAVWATPASGAAGTVNLTTLTPTRIAGTFEYGAELSSGTSATQEHTITDGAFDIPMTTASGTLPAVPDDAGSVIRATIDGNAFNAATAFAMTSTQGDGLRFTGHDLVYQIDIDLAGVTAAGSYPLDHAAIRRMSVSGWGGGASSPHCCSGLTAQDVGTITITSLTATRAQGTFSATLQPQANSNKAQALTVTNGTFDVGR